MFAQFLRTRGSPGRESSRVVALDLGERRTRVVIAEGSASALHVVASSDEPTPPGLLSGGRVARPADVAAWVRRALAGSTPSDEVWTACPSADVQVKRLQVPDPGSREATLRGLSVNPAFRTAGGDSHAGWRHDYHVVDPASGAVMAVAARLESVRTAILAVSGAGARVGGVTVAESAAVHAWLGTAAHPDARAVLVEAGHNGVTLVVMDGGEPVGFRRLLYGGKVLSERGGWFPPAEIPPPLVEEWCARIAQEVRMLTGAVFRGGGDGTPPVVLMGALAEAEELVAGLATALGSAVERWRGPGGGGEGDGGEGMGCGMAVAYGLARQGLAQRENGDGPLIQLLRPDDERESGRAEAVRPMALAAEGRVRAAVAVLLLAAAGCGAAETWLKVASRRAGAALEVARADSARAEADIARMARLSSERARLGGATATIARLAGGRQATARLMDRLAAAIPAYAWADSLTVEPGDGSGGAAFRISGYAGTSGQVAELERRISGAPVADVRVVSLAPAAVAGLTVVRWTLVGRLHDAMPESGMPGYRPQDDDAQGAVR